MEKAKPPKTSPRLKSTVHIQKQIVQIFASKSNLLMLLLFFVVFPISLKAAEKEITTNEIIMNKKVQDFHTTNFGKTNTPMASLPNLTTSWPRLVASLPVPLWLLPEMEKIPNEDQLDRSLSTLNFTPTQAFHKAWAIYAPLLLPKLDKSHFIDMSKWAQKEMTHFELPKNWFDALPLVPLAINPMTQLWLFGTPPEKSSLELPSHSPIVFRRGVIFAWFDPSSGCLTEIIVTIRGWAEE